MAIYSKSFKIGVVPANGVPESLGTVPDNHTWVIRNITAWALGDPALYVVVIPALGASEITVMTQTVGINPSPNIDTRITLPAGALMLLKSSAGAIAVTVSGYDLIAA